MAGSRLAGRDLENLCHVIVAREGACKLLDGIEDVPEAELLDHHRLKLRVPLGEVREVE